MLLLIKFILAFCSIVYELILAQSLSAFLENTVLRYSVTIGLYMFSLGVGSLLAEGKLIKNPIRNLINVEILLTLFGGLSVVFLCFVDNLDLGRLFFSLVAHSLIILIGILTGFELPMIMEILHRDKRGKDNAVLSFDYAGALVGTLFFAFVFYPKMGLIPSAFFVGLLNALAGLLLFSKREKTDESYEVLFFVQSLFLILMAGCLFYSDGINAYFINLYMG